MDNDEQGWSSSAAASRHRGRRNRRSRALLKSASRARVWASAARSGVASLLACFRRALNTRRGRGQSNNWSSFSYRRRKFTCPNLHVHIATRDPAPAATTMHATVLILAPPGVQQCSSPRSEWEHGGEHVWDGEQVTRSHGGRRSLKNSSTRESFQETSWWCESLRSSSRSFAGWRHCQPA